MGNITNLLCDKLYSDLIQKQNNLRNIAMSNRDSIFGMSDRLRGLTPTSNFASILGQLSTLRGLLPNLDQGSAELYNMLLNCTWLGSQIVNPSDALYSIIGVLNGKIGDLMRGMGSDPFMKAINDLFGLGNRLGTYDLFGLTGQIDQILQCLDAVCGFDVSDDIDDINSNMDSLTLDPYGRFDSGSMVNNINNPEAKYQFQTIMGNSFL